jgi:hypothetical protein
MLLIHHTPDLWLVLLKTHPVVWVHLLQESTSSLDKLKSFSTAMHGSRHVLVVVAIQLASS